MSSVIMLPTLSQLAWEELAKGTLSEEGIESAQVLIQQYGMTSVINPHSRFIGVIESNNLSAVKVFMAHPDFPSWEKNPQERSELIFIALKKADEKVVQELMRDIPPQEFDSIFAGAFKRIKDISEKNLLFLIDHEFSNRISNATGISVCWATLPLDGFKVGSTIIIALSRKAPFHCLARNEEVKTQNQRPQD